MIAFEMPNLIDTALHHETQSAILKAEDGICTILYDAVENDLLALLR